MFFDKIDVVSQTEERKRLTMSDSRMFEQGGRVLVLSGKRLSEISPKTKPFYTLYTFFKRAEEDIKIATVLAGYFLLFGVVSGGALGTLFYTINNRNSDINTILIEGTLLGAMAGVFFGFGVMLCTLCALAAVFKKTDDSGFLIAKLDLTNIILHASSVSKVFEYYDTTMAAIELRRKVSYAGKLLNESDSDLAVYEDLRNKKNMLQKEHSKKQRQTNTIARELEVEFYEIRKAKKEKEVLEFLDAA